MSEEKKKELEDLVETLKDLDEKSLAMISGGAKMLKARQELDGNTEKVG